VTTATSVERRAGGPGPAVSVFNNPDAVVEGWYWVLRSDALGRGRAAAVTLMGRDLVVYRGQDGAVAALDAYCPHMGAHLAEGTVEGSTIRCLFHRWRYAADGRCVEIPSLGGDPPFAVRARAWPVAERYGLVWLWTGDAPRRPLPCVPELEDVECDTALGSRFEKDCHPHVVLINAIDEHHFNSVHHLPVRLSMRPEVVHESCIRFSNTRAIPPTSWLNRVLGRLYRGPLTYSMSYSHASTGTVTLGPDRLHFHIMFALRPTPDGRTEGQTIVLTRRRRGPWGVAFNQVVLLLTRLVGSYFARGDSRIFRSIRFALRTPVRADHAIVAFIRHVERQPTVSWWRPERADAGAAARRSGAACESGGG
jgi:phenylpropionate dioxygenase-like ring-hydroxylating dioxygenase large terminal subunit